MYIACKVSFYLFTVYLFVVWESENQLFIFDN